LREEVEVFREVNQRVLELEERVDFTERLLAQHRERGRLPAEG
jgi:tetrahydromethanopterin S-methyltransferase subunit G